jgi:hypothetical protein
VRRHTDIPTDIVPVVNQNHLRFRFVHFASSLLQLLILMQTCIDLTIYNAFRHA